MRNEIATEGMEDISSQEGFQETGEASFSLTESNISGMHVGKHGMRGFL